eukprot:5417591-Pleurochrysis_carterae.AAC.3
MLRVRGVARAQVRREAVASTCVARVHAQTHKRTNAQTHAQAHARTHNYRLRSAITHALTHSRRHARAGEVSREKTPRGKRVSEARERALLRVRVWHSACAACDERDRGRARAGGPRARGSGAVWHPAAAGDDAADDLARRHALARTRS